MSVSLQVRFLRGQARQHQARRANGALARWRGRLPRPRGLGTARHGRLEAPRLDGFHLLPRPRGRRQQGSCVAHTPGLPRQIRRHLQGRWDRERGLQRRQAARRPDLRLLDGQEEHRGGRAVFHGGVRGVQPTVHLRLLRGEHRQGSSPGPKDYPPHHHTRARRRASDPPPSLSLCSPHDAEKSTSTRRW